MKFDYLTINLKEPDPAFPGKKTLLRPIIPIDIIFNGKSVGVMALLDSGADCCLFSAELGRYLEIDIKSGIRRDMSGIKGEKIETYFHDVSIKIGGWQTNLCAGFLVSKQKNQLPFGLLGQNPIFEKYKVIFELRKKTVELR